MKSFSSLKTTTTAFFLCFFFSVNLSAQTNLVFEGAGIRGIAYAGVLQELEECGKVEQIRQVGGTSAGAIIALAICLGYTSDEIISIVGDMKYNQFNDGRFFFVGGVSRVIKRFGWYKGKRFTRWIEHLIEAKTHSSETSFAQMHEGGFKDLFVTGVSLNRQKLIVFSHKTYPDMKVKDAVRISMSIPLYFEPLCIDSTGKIYNEKNKNETHDLMIDGGLLANFPIGIFDDTINNERIPNPHTLGFRIDSQDQIDQDKIHPELTSMPIRNFREYITAFYTIVLESINRPPLTEGDWQRTVSISDAGIGPKVKNLSATKREKLIESGRVAVRAYYTQEQF